MDCITQTSPEHSMFQNILITQDKISRAGVADTAGPVLAGPLLEIGRACACAYDEVGVAPTCGGSSACVCGPAVSSALPGNPPRAEKGWRQAHT